MESTKRTKQLQEYLSSRFVDFDSQSTTDRLHSLYSDFSNLNILNPYAYESNIKYWRDVILDCNIHGHLNTGEEYCMINVEELPDLFYRVQKGKPLSLNSVTESMMESNELITQQKFESMYPSDHSWFQWVVNKSKSWILPTSTSHSLIVLVTVKAIAKSILDQFYQKPLTSWLDTLFTFHEFKARYGTFNGKALSDADVWLVLRYLGYKMGLGVVESIELYGTAFMAIKFPDRVETAAQKPVELSENDKAVIGLKTTRVALLGRIDELQAKSDEFLEISRKHYKQNHKPQAAYMLKKKKQVESILEKKLTTLETIETILLKLETSQNDIQVVQAFNLGADALRGLMKQVDADKVDETMDKVRDTLEDQKEAEDALAAGSEQVTNTILDSQQDDDEELEKELELLLTNQDNTSTKTQVPRLNGIKASPPLNSAMPQKPESSHEPESETELEEKPTRKKVGEKVAIPL